MTVSIEGLSVWLPSRGTVLDAVSADLAGVTLVTGRNGSGATTLLRALAGRLVPGARVAGSVRIEDVTISGLTDTELAGLVDATHLADPCLERALANPTARMILLDQPLARLAPDQRLEACAAIRRRAEAGAVIVWAEHLVEEAISSVDHVAEIVAFDRVEVAERTRWNPRTVPAPPAMALARDLGLSRDHWTATESALAGGLLGRVTTQLRTPRRSVGDRLCSAPPELTKIGRSIELHEGECLGVVSVEGDRAAELDLARRLVAVARGERHLAQPLVLPAWMPVAQLMTGWEQRHRLAPGSLASYVDPLVRPAGRRLVRDHSPGEVAALAWALAMSRPGTRLLVEPTTGLDPAARRHVARAMDEDQAGLTCLVSGDVEVLTRACHRLIVISEGDVLADGGPLAVLDQLPRRPQLARVGARALRVRDLATTGSAVAR